MQAKTTLKIAGTLLFLLGVFGYLFPHWGHTTFTNNENAFHCLIGLIALALAEAAPTTRRMTIVVLAALFLLLGIYGFSLKQPTSFHIRHITAQLDLVDNIVHILFGLIFAWFGMRGRR